MNFICVFQVCSKLIEKCPSKIQDGRHENMFFVISTSDRGDFPRIIVIALFLNIFIIRTYLLINQIKSISMTPSDRYMCICHPFHHWMNIRRARIIVSVLASVVFVIGGIVSSHYTIYVKTTTQVTTVPQFSTTQPLIDTTYVLI